MTGGLIDVGGGMGDTGGGGTVGTPAFGEEPADEPPDDPLPESPTNDDASPGDTPDLDLGDANPGAGERNDAEESEGIVVDSDPSEPGGGQTIISDGADGEGDDDEQQDLADQVREQTSGGGTVDSGVVDSETGEYVDTGGSDSGMQEPSTDAAGVGDIPREALAGLALLAVLLVAGGSR